MYAVDASSRFHDRCARWLEDALNGTTRVGLPWPTLAAFLRIATHPKALDQPLSSSEAIAYIDAWLDAPAGWVPLPTPNHRFVLASLVERYDLRADRIPDAHLAALAIEHGIAICSADSDFARFSEVDWFNPLADAPRR